MHQLKKMLEQLLDPIARWSNRLHRKGDAAMKDEPKINVDMSKVTVRDVDRWIEARLQTLQNRAETFGQIEVDQAEMKHLTTFRRIMDRMAVAAHLNSPAILDSLERRRIMSIQRHNSSSDSLEPV